MFISGQASQGGNGRTKAVIPSFAKKLWPNRAELLARLIHHYKDIILCTKKGKVRATILLIL